MSLTSTFTPVQDMTDDSIAADLREIAEIRPTPDWAFARVEELRAEKRRRLISLDGDIGRRDPRVVGSSVPPLRGSFENR